MSVHREGDNPSSMDSVPDLRDHNSLSSTPSVSIPSSTNTSRRGSLSSSRPEFRPVHTEIIKRNLVKEFLTSCSYKEKRTTTKSIQKKMDKTMSVFTNWMLDQEEEDELDPNLRDIIGDKKRRKSCPGMAVDVENDMLFNIDF